MRDLYSFASYVDDLVAASNSSRRCISYENLSQKTPGNQMRNERKKWKIHGRLGASQRDGEDFLAFSPLNL